ncbi:hypothetical protein NQ317_007981 [Molorchus minor]|uniref:Reverse transcriptase n=1 Tax=Molorchus minor TaxID=1323400 RepID=A0ABQ9IVX4_9CUCU|nr:hypothetical protein NQ317_007981 [Molorchus minor]
MKGTEDPFARRDSITRSPPELDSAARKVIDITGDEEEPAKSAMVQKTLMSLGKQFHRNRTLSGMESVKRKVGDTSFVGEEEDRSGIRPRASSLTKVGPLDALRRKEEPKTEEKEVEKNGLYDKEHHKGPGREIRYLAKMAQDNDPQELDSPNNDPGGSGDITVNGEEGGEEERMPRIGGPSDTKRRLLYNVVVSTILYGAEIWHGAMRVRLYRETLEKAQRKMLLGIVGAYRTTSTEALQNPRERKGVKKSERVTPLESGKRDGVREGRGVGREPLSQESRNGFLDCRHRQVDYYLAQFLTGHGSFGQYLKRIGKIEDQRCRYCGAEEDTPRHTVMECNRFATVREAVWEELEIEDEADLLRKMMASKDNWCKIHQVIRDTMTNKRGKKGINRMTRAVGVTTLSSHQLLCE